MNGVIPVCLFPIAILLLYSPFQSPNGFSIPFGTTNETLHSSELKFPKDRPYHYADFTTDIPHNFLPVKTSALPYGHGVWVLRYRDFSGLPQSFQADNGKDTSKSVISFRTTFSIFEGVTIKLLAFGDVQFDIVFTNRAVNIGEREIDYVDERLPLIGKNGPENCTLPNSEGNNGKGLKWTVFEVENIPDGDMTLEAKILHSKAFIILDEITINYGNCSAVASRDGSGACSEKMKGRTNKVTSCEFVD